MTPTDPAPANGASDPPPLSRRVTDIRPSATLALDARAKAMAAEGRDVVNMAVGEPDFPAPEAARKAGIARIESGNVRYTPAAGTAELRTVIAEHLTATRAIPFEMAQITVCHSAKHALSGALLTMLGDGDGVLIPLPGWVSYTEMVRAAGGRPILVPPSPGCRPDLDAIAAAARSEGARVLMVNSPSNPSGYVWTDDEIRGAAEIAIEHNLWLLSDEIYRRLVYEGPPAASPVSVLPEVASRTVIVDGASKSLAMTGYRIGFLAGPRDFATAVARLHSQLTGSPNTVSQAAYQAALVAEPAEVAEMVATFAERRNRLLEGLEKMGLETPSPRGAFYAFPDVGGLLDGRGSVGFCEDLLEAEGLALVPGAAFGMDGHVRLSYALGLDLIEEALARLARFIASRPGS